jgi:predicted ATP-dependent endonuclease of OLD family
MIKNLPVILKNIRAENYACYGNIRINNFEGMNLFIGANNSGKSALVKLISAYLSRAFLSLEDFFDADIRDIQKPVAVQFTLNVPNQQDELIEYQVLSKISKWNGTKNSIFPELPKSSPPQIIYIHPIRHIKSGCFETFDNGRISINGDGMLENLIRMTGEDKKKFINGLKIVLGIPISGYKVEMGEYETMKLIIQSENQEYSLPGSNYGTGIQDVVILLYTALHYKNAILCIEEPELHLHPETQRRLIKLLLTQTSNQYFIATHSAHVINTIQFDIDKQIQIYRIEQKDGKSEINLAKRDQDLFNTLSEMGYQASDLLQANCVIMVEGPSDEIYIDFWIRKYIEIHGLDFTPIPNQHYLFIRSGGNAFFDTHDYSQKVEQMISMNRNIVAVFDRDVFDDDLDMDNNNKKSKLTSLTAKKHVIGILTGVHKDEFWITKGREIENYIPKDLMISILRIHTKSGKTKLSIEDNSIQEKGNFTSKISTETGTIGDINKVKIARIVTQEINTNKNYSNLLTIYQKNPFCCLDLETRIEQLVEFIFKANGVDKTGHAI